MTLRNVTRITIFAASLGFLVGWLADPELVRAARNATTIYLPITPEPHTEEFVLTTVGLSPGGAETRSGLRVVVALAVLVLLFGSRAPAAFVSRTLRSLREGADG
ncbi:MAG: hypothetical protein ACREQ9_17295, partial [Candidatus Binatia bacterium]